VYRPVQVDVDEPTLEAIAKETGGRYFRATDTASLREIYKEIDEAEKAPIKAPEHEERREAFAWLLWPALLLVVGEAVLGETRLRKLP
jgi:Ca-activated chloride channel homolog